MRGYDIKITPVKDDRLWRIVEISDRQTLHQLSGIVRDEFSLIGNHLYCFYLGEKPYNARTAYGGPAADTRRLAVKTTLGSLGLKKGKRFLYVFDFAADRIFRLQVQRIHNVGDPSKLLRITKRHGQVARPSRSSEETKRKEALAELGDMSERLGSVADSWSQGKRPSKASVPSIISSDLTVIGTLNASGDIQIDGKVEGDINTSSITVGEKAVVNGEIRAEEAVIRGHIIGSIRAVKVHLASTAHVEGDILHHALAVETGAFFEGNCRHSDDPLNAQAPAPRPQVVTNPSRQAETPRQAASANPSANGASAPKPAGSGLLGGKPAQPATPTS